MEKPKHLRWSTLICNTGWSITDYLYLNYSVKLVYCPPCLPKPVDPNWSRFCSCHLNLLCAASRHCPFCDHFIFHHPQVKSDLVQEVTETTVVLHWKVSVHAVIIMFHISLYVLLLCSEWAICVDL